MAVQVSGEKMLEPGGRVDPQYVAGIFVKQYFGILERSPEIVHRFYKDHSVIHRRGDDGEMTSVTTMQGISDIIMSSDYKGWLAEILNVDAQESLGGGVIVAVDGFIGKDSLRKSFYQTFFLARQEKGFYILNDMLRFLEAHKISIPTVSSEGHKSSLSVHLTDTPSPESIDASALEDDSGKGAVVKKSNSSNASIQKEPTILKTSSAVEDDSKKVADVKDSHSSDASTQKEATGLKTSYASMVAKQSNTPTSSDTSGGVIMRVASTAEKQPKASPILRNHVVPNSGAAKELNSGNNMTENISSNGDGVIARSVYVGNLPSNITNHELLDAVKVFGRVRQGGIQLRRCEDGFCFGFVEFESASSAQNAVEARNITIGGYDIESYITYKKSTRSGNSGGYRGGHFKGQDNGDVYDNGAGQYGNQSDFERKARFFSRENGETNPRRSQSRDARWRGRESHHWNSQRVQ